MKIHKDGSQWSLLSRLFSKETLGFLQESLLQRGIVLAYGFGERLEFGALLTAGEVAALSEQEIFAVCTQRIRDLDAKARAALCGSPPT